MSVDKLVRLTAFSSSLFTVGRNWHIRAEFLQLPSVCMAHGWYWTWRYILSAALRDG